MKKGVSYFEVLIALSLVMFIIGITFQGMLSFYYNFLLTGDLMLLVETISQARLEAINNYLSLPRGVYLTSSAYVIFSGNSYEERDNRYDLVFSRSGRVGITSPFTQIVFHNFSATTSASGTIVLKLDNKKKEIIINNEALLDWQ